MKPRGWAGEVLPVLPQWQATRRTATDRDLLLSFLVTLAIIWKSFITNLGHATSIHRSCFWGQTVCVAETHYRLLRCPLRLDPMPSFLPPYMSLLSLPFFISSSSSSSSYFSSSSFSSFSSSPSLFHPLPPPPPLLLFLLLLSRLWPARAETGPTALEIEYWASK